MKISHYCTCRPSVSFRGKTDCFSPKHRWPEDIAWHPDGDKIFAVYTADSGDSQVSMANLISGQVRTVKTSAFPYILLHSFLDSVSSCCLCSAEKILGLALALKAVPIESVLG